METTLTEADINKIATSVVELIAKRLSSTPPPASPSPDRVENGSTTRKDRLAYTLKELAAELGLSRVTIYRLEMRGLIKSVPGIRHKLYSRTQVEHFLAGKHPGWK